MLQRVLAALLCLLGVVAIGLAVASATLWRPSDTLTATASPDDGVTLLTTEPGVLDMAADEVTVEVSGPGQVVLALGRTADVAAWVGADEHATVTGLVDRETLRVVEGTPVAPEQPDGTAAATASPAPSASASRRASATPSARPTPAPTASQAADEPAEGAAAAVPDPRGSDLWLDEVSGTGSAEMALEDLEGRVSVLAASVGEDAGTPTLTLTWPQEVRTPWLAPGVAVGAVLLLAGLAWFALLLLRERGVGPFGRSRTRAVAAGAAGPAVVTRAGAAPASPVGQAPARAGTAVPVPARTSSVVPTAGAAPAPGAPVPGPGTVDPDAPLTRRQIRERERLVASGRTGELPVVAPRGAGPAAPSAPATPAVPTPAGRPAPVGDDRPTATLPRVPAAGPAPEERGRAGVSDGLAARVSRLSDRFQRRPHDAGDGAGAPPGTATAPRPGAAPGPAAPTGPQQPSAPGPVPPSGGVPDARPQAREQSAGSTADAWRRAWGFSGEPGDDPDAGSGGRPAPGRPADPRESDR